jgi:hypothetical protein
MGLDITAYSRLVQTADPDGEWLPATDAEFIARNDGLESTRYAAEKCLRFQAGSYGGYNQWRDQLAQLAGYPKVRHLAGYKPPEDLYAAGAWAATEGPFWELINFSDCEGFIGPKTSAKLAADFAAFQDKADAHPEQWFRDRYAKWRAAFELASNDGAVAFH